MKIFPIVFACDDKYVKYTSVVIASIISNVKENIKYSFFILSQNVSETNQKILKEFITKYKNFTIDFITLSNIDIIKFPIKDYYSVEIYFRFFIPTLFKDYDRVLYLDSDIIVDFDISDLATIDFENNAAIAIQDRKHSKFIERGGEDWYPAEYFYNTLQLKDPQRYFNSGVMLFNNKIINSENISEKFFTILSSIGKPKMLDQDILNSVLTRWGGVKLISNKYNYMRNIRLNPYYVSYKNLFLSRLKSLLGLDSKQEKLFYIYHFVESAKPWNSNRPDRLLFYKYLYSIHLINPPKKFVDEIIKENNRKFPLWWKLFMKFFS